jgi:DNA-binding XRE family transcriptional regulator
MTANEFRAALAEFGLTQQACARFLGAGERSVRRWATEDGTVPRSVVLVFALMARYGLTPEDVRAAHAATRAGAASI